MVLGMVEGSEILAALELGEARAHLDSVNPKTLLRSSAVLVLGGDPTAACERLT
jgi:hypothetical protein